MTTIKRKGLFIIEQSNTELYIWFKGKLIYKKWSYRDRDTSKVFDLHGLIIDLNEN